MNGIGENTRPSGAPGPAASVARWLAPLFLAAFLFLVYNLNGRFIGGSDVYSTRFMGVMLAKKGLFTNFPEAYYFPSYEEKKPWNMGTFCDDPNSPSYNRVISVYPTYLPTLLYPLYWVLYSPQGYNLEPEHYLTWYLDKWIASFIAAMTGALVFSLIRRLHGGKNARALLVTLGMALGTSIWSTSSQGTWSVGPSAFFLIAAVWAMERAVRLMGGVRSQIWACVSGWAIASAFAMRLSDIFFVLPFFFFGMWELRKSRAAQIAFFAGIAPVAAWFCIHNYVYFGNPLTTGYKYNMAQQRLHNLMHLENFPAGFIGLLFSPSLGMFTMGPVTLFAIPGFATMLLRRRRRLETRPDGTAIEEAAPLEFLQRVMRLGIPFVIVHILFYSCYLEWWGGWSYCYRYLIDIQPFIALGAGWFLRPGACCAKFRWPLYIPALLLSCAVQWYGAFLWGGAYWGQKTPQGYVMAQFSIDHRHYLNLDPHKGFKGIFTVDSYLYSLRKEHHVILTELIAKPGQQTPFDWSFFTTWDKFKRPLATPAKLKKDLFERKTYDFRHGTIIIYQGI